MRVLPRSLFGQLVLAQCAILAVVAICMPLILSHILGSVAGDFVARRLHHDADRLAASIYRDRAGWHVRPDARMGPFFDGRSASRAYVVVDGAGHVIARSHGRFVIVASSFSPPREEAFLRRGSSDLLIRPLAGGVDGVWAVVGQDREHPDVIIDNVVSAFLVRLMWIIPVTMLVSLLLGAGFVRRATRNIALVSREADAIQPDRLDVRLSTDRLPIEARPLARAANLALDRVEAGYRAQAEFVANVAHELRTPLALIALRADAAEPGLKAQLREAVARASHVVSQLMELAFVANLHPGLETVDLQSIAQNAVEIQAPLVFRSGRSIEFQEATVPVAPVMGSPGLIGIALTNLIDNAIRHTPAGTRIVIAVCPGGAILVTDDGPGISADISSLARTRYWRADTRRSDSAGLGLAIVERIMAALGGGLTLTAAEEGGTRVTLTFNKSPPVRLA